MRICQIVPYYTGSHADWADDYAHHSRHTIDPVKMAGRFWKWRMHGGAVTAARLFAKQAQPDLILATDMLDVATFLALTRKRTWDTPVALYMHENQLTYPPAPGEKIDLHYGFINYVSMLAAERVYFNSQYHLESWFEALPNLLKHFPDYNELGTVKTLRAKSEVLPLGLSLSRLDSARPDSHADGPLRILWNHRWEYDKNPETFFQALATLHAEGFEFEVILLGEHFVHAPKVFQTARKQLGERIIQFGYVPSYDDYARWLWQADIVVSTAYQEFFGAAVVEAMYCDCWPILPKRLTYPQFVPEAYTSLCLYDEDTELVERLRWACENLAWVRAHSLREQAARYDWQRIAPEYDLRFEELAQTTGQSG